MLTGLQTLFALYPMALPIAAGIFGLAIGSFLNVVVLRLPVMMERQWREDCRALAGAGPERQDRPLFNLMTPGSHCPHCGHRITALENIPVLSFLGLRGRCSGCSARISWRYPMVELLTGAASALVAWHFGPSWQSAFALALTWALIALAFIDYDQKLLPDSITLPFLWLGLLANIPGLFARLDAAVIGAVGGYLSLWLIFHLFRLVTGKEGMGFGDFKLFSLFGAWLGWAQLPLIILLASALGSVIGLGLIVLARHDRDHPIPFGPFLCLAGWVALLWGGDILHAYLQFARIGA